MISPCGDSKSGGFHGGRSRGQLNGGSSGGNCTRSKSGGSVAATTTGTPELESKPSLVMVSDPAAGTKLSS
jgi:hypothetical protein